MGLRDRLRNLEEAAKDETMTLVCPECGAEFVVYGDVPVEFICYEWVRESGGKTYRETPEELLRVIDHAHDPSAFVEKSSGLPFLSREVSGMNLGAVPKDVEDLSE